MAKVALRKFHVEDGQRARHFEVGDEVPDEFEGRYDPKLVQDSVPVEAAGPSGEPGGAGSDDGGELSSDERAELEQLKTIEQISTWVDMGGPNKVVRARVAYEAEMNGGQRKGLLEALEAVLAEAEGGDQ